MFLVLLASINGLEQFCLVVKVHEWLDEGLLLVSGGDAGKRLGLYVRGILIYLHVLVDLHPHGIFREVGKLKILIISVSLLEGICLARE